MTERDLPYLQHVLDACADIGEFVASGRAVASRSKLVLDGIAPQLRTGIEALLKRVEA